MALEGLDKVLKNIQKEIDHIEGASLDGLKAAALKVQRLSDKRTPVDTGNLKSSGETITLTSSPPVVAVSYSANYAVFVHENLEARHTNGRAKFLESAVRDLEAEIVNTVASFAKI